MQDTCREVLAELGVDHDPTLQMAQELERIALEDEFFVERRLYPNVDFYSGIILKAIGIPVEMFTVIFVTGRTPGWIAHWKEMVSAPYKIGASPAALHRQGTTRLRADRPALTGTRLRMATATPAGDLEPRLREAEISGARAPQPSPSAPPRGPTSPPLRSRAALRRGIVGSTRD